MHALTMDTIKAAQDNNAEALETVLAAMTIRISSIAFKLAPNADQRAEFEQVGRIAVWEALPRFAGDNTEAFFSFMWATADGKMRDAARSERSRGATGADNDALKIFAAMFEVAGGDIEVAESLCQTYPPKGRRLSAERAYAARRVWAGVGSLTHDHGLMPAEEFPTDFGVPGDLVEPADLNHAERDRKTKIVRAVLDTMGAKQAHILRATYGIDPVPCLGTDAEANEELAATLDTTPGSVKVLRVQAHKSFETRYSKVTGLTK